MAFNDIYSNYVETSNKNSVRAKFYENYYDDGENSSLDWRIILRILLIRIRVINPIGINGNPIAIT